jgi:hypothetical protein
MVKHAPAVLSIALDVTRNAAQLTVKLVSLVLTLSSNLHADFKFAPAHALSLFSPLVAEPSVPLSLTMTPPLLVVLSTVLWTIGAHGLSARRVFQTARLPHSKLEVERFSFKLHVAAEIAPPSSLKLVNVPRLHAIEIARYPIGNLGLIAMLAVVTVSRSEHALLLLRNLDMVWIVLPSWKLSPAALTVQLVFWVPSNMVTVLQVVQIPELVLDELPATPSPSLSRTAPLLKCVLSPLLLSLALLHAVLWTVK